MRALCLLLCLIAAGCARPLVASVGYLDVADGELIDARRRVVEHPGDRGARLELARVSHRRGLAGAALEELEIAERIGGPGDSVWQSQDRGLQRELLLRRGHARVERGSAAAAADLDRARALGGRIDPEIYKRAVLAAALSELRHSDEERRRRGYLRLQDLGASRVRGVSSRATPDERLALARWLWQAAARHAAREVLLRGARVSGPAADGLWAEVETWWNLAATGRVSPPALGGQGFAEAAVASLRDFLRGDHRDWDDRLRAEREAHPAWTLDDVPLAARPTWLRLHGEHAGLAAALDAALAAPPALEEHRLLLAAEAVIALRGQVVVAAVLGPARDSADGQRLWQRAYGEQRGDVDRAQVAARYVAARLARPLWERALAEVARGFFADPAVAERRAREFADVHIDRAEASAALGHLFDVLGDPARSRLHWQLAVDRDPTNTWQLALAQAMARSGDPDAAMIPLTAAAAASSEAAATFISGAQVLLESGHPALALSALKSGLSLADPRLRDRALSLAAQANHQLGRVHAAAELEAALTARGAPVRPTPNLQDLQAVVAEANAIARLAVRCQWRVFDLDCHRQLLRALPVEDPRRRRSLAQLADLAADADPDLARAAAVVAANSRW
jgi:tetratricopeptide (TPR) repeat protein